MRRDEPIQIEADQDRSKFLASVAGENSISKSFCLQFYFLKEVENRLNEKQP